jgi:hypothetical protein
MSVPFYILHVDLWQPGRTKAKLSGETHLLAAMCDLTGFILSQSISDVSAVGLAHTFMQEMLLKVGLCGLIVVDAASAFRDVFEAMCKTLDIRFHAAARGNHKAVSVERYFRFLNKAVAIAANDRNTNQIFVETAQCAAYAWNSSCIDGTDIVRSVAAVGREFQFPLDMTLQPPPIPVHGDVFSVHSFLRLAQRNSNFAVDILQLLTDERRTYHRERINESRSQQLFDVGDSVLVRVAVQSNAQTNKVAKLEYRLRGPYTVIEVLGHGAYQLRKLNAPDGALWKYHAEDISLLPPVIRPVEPLDGPDLRYMNHNHAPIHHPLKAAFGIKLYNDKWLSPQRDTQPPLLSSSPQASEPSQVPLPTPPANQPELAIMPLTVPVVQHDRPAVVPLFTPAALHTAISESGDRLFFVSVTSNGTLRDRWYLVAVDLPQTAAAVDICGDPATTGLYYVHFYTRHPSDVSETDLSARWWPEWHEYTRDADGIVDYGDRFLVYPTRTPRADRYIAWADTVNLCDPATRLLGPFDFLDPSLNPPGRSVSFRQYVPAPLWADLAELCLSRGILPPDLAPPLPSATIVSKKRRRPPTVC